MNCATSVKRTVEPPFGPGAGIVIFRVSRTTPKPGTCHAKFGLPPIRAMSANWRGSKPAGSALE